MSTGLIAVLIHIISFSQNNFEVLSFKSSTINGTAPGFLSKSELIKNFGKPLKVEKFVTECAMTELQEKAKSRNVYYYDGLTFFVYDNYAELMEIDFRNGKYSYQTKLINLDRNTRFLDLEKVYPKSTRMSILENDATKVKISPCIDCDGYCVLYLEKGKLVKLEWWEPC